MKVWVARDSDGGVYMYANKPWRQEIDKMWLDSSTYQDYKYEDNGCIQQLPVDSFPELTWEDEPLEIDRRDKRLTIWIG